MKRIVSQGKSYLWFPDQPVIAHRWQTIGMIIAPQVDDTSVLNFFRVFISGNTKSKVENFIEYQEEQGRNNKRSIQVLVEKLDELPADYVTEIPEPKIPDIEEVQRLFEQQQHQPDFLFNLGTINIGIDRVYMGTKLPYKITYVIDPTFVPLLQGEKWYSTQLGADNLYVTCDGQSGTVHLIVTEEIPWGGREDRDSMDVHAGESRTFPVITKKYTGSWQVNVTGVALDNAFNLEYTRYFPV